MAGLSFEQIRERLAARFGDAVGATVAAKDPFVVVKGERLPDVGRVLHDDPEFRFDFLQDLTAVDYPKENLIRVVYHLWSYGFRHGFKMKVECDRAAPRAPSVESIWRAANWLEREVLDLFGVEFVGHPDPRRIMMPDDWVGHPLRKDYQEAGGYHGMSNVRVSPLDQYLELDKERRAQNPPPAAPKPAPEAKPAPAAAPVEAAKPAPETKPAPVAAPVEAAVPAPEARFAPEPAEAPKAEAPAAEGKKPDGAS